MFLDEHRFDALIHVELFRGWKYRKLKPEYKEIALWVVDGLSHREIARRLGIEQQSVKNILSRVVYPAAGVKNQDALKSKIWRWRFEKASAQAAAR